MDRPKTSTITDYDIQALVDNELDDDKAQQVVAYLKENPRACERFKDLIKQKNILQNWWSNKTIS